MYPTGEIITIHPNGRINYKNQPTLADGSDIKSLAALKASMKIVEASTLLDKVRLQARPYQH